jgi:hypothetical protein
MTPDQIFFHLLHLNNDCAFCLVLLAFLVVLMWNEIILNIEEFFQSYKAICIFVEDSIK